MNKDYLQNSSAKAAYELVEFFDKDSFNDDSTQYVKAYAYSRVDTPNDLFDKYSYSVADIIFFESQI